MTRRALLAAGAAAFAPPARAATDDLLRARLDAIQAGLKATPEALAAAAAELGGLDPAGLSPIRRLELEAVRRGLNQEAQLLRRPSYAGRLRLAYGAPVTAAQAEQRAWAEIHALRARADRLLRGQGLAKGSVAERLRRFAGDERHLFADSSAGRDAAVAEMNRRLAGIRPRLARAFGDLPIPAAEVRRMSPVEEAAGRAGYRDPAAGAYFVDLKAIRARPAWSLASVAYHETIPGHLLQLAQQEPSRPHPLRLRYAPAYFEAWAIHAERVAAGLGAYDGDPLGELGYLQWRLFRIGRIVADLGLGAHGWSADQAEAVLADIQGVPAAFISIADDVARMAQSPGKVAAEGLGALAFARLAPGREPTAFHRAALSQGPWPFGLLARVIGG